MVDRERDELTVAELLTEATEEEIARRDGEWDAFTCSVFRRLDAEAVAHQRADLEAQAIALFKQEIDLELSELSPGFEEAFKESVEKRIFQSAIVPSWTHRLSAWFERARGDGFGLGWAGAAAAVVLLVFAAGTMQTGTQIDDTLMDGHVAVQEISFEGDVTVLPDDGVTIIWLDGSAT